MLTANSWANALHAATTPREKAVILLQRAQQRQSKKLIEQDIAEAINHIPWFTISSVEHLLKYHSLPYTQAGLHEAARRFAELIPTIK